MASFVIVRGDIVILFESKITMELPFFAFFLCSRQFFSIPLYFQFILLLNLHPLYLYIHVYNVYDVDRGM